MLLVTVPDRHLMDIGFLFLILEDPAFSLPMRLRGHLPWARFLIYSLVQLLSVFCASGVPTLSMTVTENKVGGTCVWLTTPQSSFE